LAKARNAQCSRKKTTLAEIKPTLPDRALFTSRQPSQHQKRETKRRNGQGGLVAQRRLA
jgi:hypothetical protein